LRHIRSAVAILAAAAMAPALAQTPAQPAPVHVDQLLRLETYRLWEGRAPEAASQEQEEIPTLTVFRPMGGHENGTAVVVAPGGGYVALATDLEGRQVADWFASRGVTAFVLKYRFGAKAPLPVPLIDGERAVRFVRAHAQRFGVDPRRIGIIGFSAGGHLSAMTAVNADKGRADAADPVERASSRPDFLILGYPWLEATEIRPDGQSWYCQFAKFPCKAAEYSRFTPLGDLPTDMPPTFIYHTTDDGLVPVRGSVRFFTKLTEKKVPVELHAFRSGPHGTGLGGYDPALARWPELLEHWMRHLKLLEKGVTSEAQP
jgi:acetyl esterase/lipase